jgi:hypothetical protein
MTIPANLTHAEAGAFLMAVGEHMVDHDVCASAVLAPDMLADDAYLKILADDLWRAAFGGGQDLVDGRAEEILTNLTLEEAIAFVRIK